MPWASQMRKIHPDLLAGIVRHLERFGAIDHTKRSRIAEAKRHARDLIGRCGCPNDHRALIAYLSGRLHWSRIRERLRVECEKIRPLYDYEAAERRAEFIEAEYLRAAIDRQLAKTA